MSKPLTFLLFNPQNGNDHIYALGGLGMPSTLLLGGGREASFKNIVLRQFLSVKQKVMSPV